MVVMMCQYVTTFTHILNVYPPTCILHITNIYIKSVVHHLQKLYRKVCNFSSLKGNVLLSSHSVNSQTFLNTKFFLLQD